MQEMSKTEAASFVDKAQRQQALEDYLAKKPWGGLSPETLAYMESGKGFDGVGRLNIYTCKSCRGHVVTRDLVKGVTPFTTICQATAGCSGTMSSSMYRVFDQNMRASHVWYRPEAGTCFTGSTRDHLTQGGLLLRKAEAGEG